VKILSLLKQVPDPDSLRFDASGNLAPNTTRVVNEYDEYGLEAALQLKEAREDVEVVVLSIGGSNARDAVSRGLSMGADRGILVERGDGQIGSLGIARAVAEIVQEDDYSIVWLGHESSDSGTGNLGPQLSALIQMPFISNVVAFELTSDGTAQVTREVEDGHVEVEASLPLVLCALSGLDEPRYPTLKGIMAARRKPIEERSFTDLDIDPDGVSWGELREEERVISGEIIDVEDPEEAALKLIELLRERDLI
jgi:electron transfer flavoprotein beta subunit